MNFQRAFIFLKSIHKTQTISTTQNYKSENYKDHPKAIHHNKGQIYNLIHEISFTKERKTKKEEAYIYSH